MAGAVGQDLVDVVDGYPAVYPYAHIVSTCATYGVESVQVGGVAGLARWSEHDQHTVYFEVSYPRPIHILVVGVHTEPHLGGVTPGVPDEAVEAGLATVALEVDPGHTAGQRVQFGGGIVDHEMNVEACGVGLGEMVEFGAADAGLPCVGTVDAVEVNPEIVLSQQRIELGAVWGWDGDQAAGHPGIGGTGLGEQAACHRTEGVRRRVGGVRPVVVATGSGGAGHVRSPPRQVLMSRYLA